MGEVGVDFQDEPVSHFLMELGVGYGLSGVQLSWMPKLVFGSPRHRFITGVGVSLALPGVPVVTHDGPYGSNLGTHVPTTWLTLDAAGYEYRSPGGVSFFVAGGPGLSLTHACAEFIDSCQQLYGMPFPQLRIGLGIWQR